MAPGSLRIYLGAAPGVGKTFAMLAEGRRRRERGEDVAVALVETHGRRRTAEQVGDLEVVARAHIEYRGRDFQEMDLDAVLARRPQVALVDELAHTNVPGSRNAKRWQDVDELLASGIDVISTLNVQHLESLNDVVEQITGVAQAETIPDEVVRRADQLQLVDLAEETVRARLARGDIYPLERIDAALGNFFRPGNLGALRELALLWIADRVDEALTAYRARQGIAEPWETRERVLVALTGTPEGERLVRRAARIAQRANGELVAVHVVPEDGLAASAGELLGGQRRLVERLGGRYVEVAGADVAETLVDAAQSLNATQIVLGATRRSRARELVHGSVIYQVIRRSGPGIDVHVISRREDEPGGGAHLLTTRARRGLPRRRVAAGFALAAAALPAATGILTSFRDEVALPSVLLLFLLLVVTVAAVGGIWPALACAVAAVLLVNWFFTPPVHTFTIGTGENLFALMVFVTVAAVVSSFVALAARRAAEGARARAEADALSGLAGTSSVAALLDAVRRSFGCRAAGLLRRTADGWRLEAASGPAPATPQEATATVPVDASRLLVIGGGRPPHQEDRRVLDAFARELASACDMERLAAVASTAGRLTAADELRTAVLRAVSHDLRSPLSAIKASATSLLQDDVPWSHHDRRQFLETIDEETDRLDVLVGNLLDMSRLEAGSVEPLLRPVAVQDVVATALRSLGPSVEVDIVIPDDVPEVHADPGLLERALANIVANALVHTPPGGRPRIVAGAVPGGVDVRVADRGAGVSEPDRDLIFLPFQRLGDRASGSGLGLGLAVARGFVDAMGGRVEAEETPGGGLTIVVQLDRAP